MVPKRPHDVYDMNVRENSLWGMSLPGFHDNETGTKENTKERQSQKSRHRILFSLPLSERRGEIVDKTLGKETRTGSTKRE